jgi:hypothetical protein
LHRLQDQRDLLVEHVSDVDSLLRRLKGHESAEPKQVVESAKTTLVAVRYFAIIYVPDGGSCFFFAADAHACLLFSQYWPLRGRRLFHLLDYSSSLKIQSTGGNILFLVV